MGNMFNIFILGLVSLLTDISTELVYPLLPLYLTIRLGASATLVGIIEGIAESLASLTKVFSGYFSDLMKRRKPFTILGYAGSTVGKVFLYFSNSWGWVFCGRLIDRFGKGIRTAPRDALIADSSTAGRRGQAFGFHRTLDTLGAVLGVLGAYYFLTRFKSDYQKIFLLSLIPAGLGVLLLFAVREKLKAHRKEEKHVRPAFSWSKLDKRLKAFLILTFIFSLGNSSNQFLLLRANNIGFEIKDILLLYLAYNVSYAVLSYPAGRLSDFMGRKVLLVTGYFWYGLVYLGFALANNAWQLWVLFIAYGFYVAMTESVEKALVTDIAPVDLRATLIGMHATLVGLGLLPASLLAGFLWDILSPSAPFYLGGALGIVASIGLAIIL
jgi:MFS family permease